MYKNLINCNDMQRKQNEPVLGQRVKSYALHKQDDETKQTNCSDNNITKKK
jgi:hypothetical protein